MGKLLAFKTEVESSNLKALEIIPTEKLMIVEFLNGTKYLYTNVEELDYDTIVQAESVGKAFNAFKKLGNDYHKI